LQEMETTTSLKGQLITAMQARQAEIYKKIRKAQITILIGWLTNQVDYMWCSCWWLVWVAFGDSLTDEGV